MAPKADQGVFTQDLPAGEQTCIHCNETKPVEAFFVSYSKTRKKYYRRRECRLCHGKAKQIKMVRYRIHKNMKAEFELATARALVRLMKFDPDLLIQLVSKHSTRFHEILTEEKRKAFRDVKNRTMRYSHNVKYTDHESVFEELEEKLLR